MTNRKAQVRGLTLLQLMGVLAVLGVVAWLGLRYLLGAGT